MELEMKTECIASTSGTSYSHGSVTNNRLGLCEVCAYNSAKYVCPNCEVKTCNLRCSGIHKRELQCKGERNPTKYIPLKKFTNFDLSSDYMLLEKISKSVENMKRNRSKAYFKHNYLPNHLFKLQRAATRNQINLKFLPPTFDRHKQNKSCLAKDINKDEGQSIFWQIDFIFPNAESLKCTECECHESEKLSTLVNKFLNGDVDPALKETLQFYISAGISGIQMFLKAEQKQGLQFYELDANLTLGENLKHKTIIEYPVIHVVLKHCGGIYTLCQFDNDEVKMDQESPSLGNQVIEKLLKAAECEDGVYGSLKNLLFVSEYSDAELSE